MIPSSKNRCLDCGKMIGQGAKRCKSCAAKRGWAQGTYDRMSEKMKEAHARGCFDGVFTSGVRVKMGQIKKEAWARGIYDEHSEKIRAAHARGDYADAQTPECMAKRSRS